MKIKAIIFDCDGTMFDTEKVSRKSFEIIAKEYGIYLNDDFFDKITGTTSNNIVKCLSQYPILQDKYPQIIKKWHELTLEEVKTKDKLNKKGLIELLKYTKEKGIKTAIASSSKIDHIDMLINHISYKHNFDAIVPGDSVNHSKPAPDIFLKASELLNIKKEECIVIEDSYNGIKAARNANIRNIYIKDVCKFTKEDYENVDIELNDLYEVIKYIDENNQFN